MPIENITEKHEQIVERNLLKPETRAATIEAIATLEGPAWLKRQEEMQKRLDEDGITDPAQVQDVAYNTLPGLLQWLNESQDKQESPDSKYVLYGNGGWNRWYVSSDGNIKFSESHAQIGHVERARELGFEIAS